MTADSIKEHDVLCGRGGATNNHTGNKRFRSIVAEYQDEYLTAKKKEKVLIATRVVERIKSKGGRFLKRDQSNDVWVEVPPKKAISKTSQALREGLDVRHKTIRPEKMPRRYNDIDRENPRKRARLVVGKVLDSPKLTSLTSLVDAGSIPELNEERSALKEVDPMLLYFAPNPFVQTDRVTEV